MERELARYEYHAAAGELLAVKVRLDATGGGQKCRWERPVPPHALAYSQLPPGAKAVAHRLTAGWYEPYLRAGVWHYEADPDRKGARSAELTAVCPGLFRLPQLLAADPREPVFVVEGEADVMTLVSLGFVATTPPHGSGMWDHGWAGPFRGRKVVVFPDNDAPGIHHANAVVGSLITYGRAAAVRYVAPGEGDYDPPEKGGDITDWLKLRHPGADAKALRAAVVALCVATPSYTVSVPTKAA